MATQTRTRRSPSPVKPLDPAKEVVEFQPIHHSLVSDPENEHRFILVQDSYSEDLGDALDTLCSLIGPMIQYVSESAYRALAQCYGAMQEKIGDSGVMEATGGQPMTVASPRLYSLSEDGSLTYKEDEEHPFGYDYPEPDVVAGVLLALDRVPETDEMAEHVAVVRSFVEGYSEEQWPFADDAIYAASGPFRESLSDLVVRSAADGEDVSGLATLAKTLTGGKGVLVLQDTPLWELFTRADGGGAHTSIKNHVHQHDGNEPHSHAHMHEAGDASHEDHPPMRSTEGEGPGVTRVGWTTKYINDLPDSAFAAIQAGGEKDDEGKTTPRRLRKLPHHDASGSLDLPHLRNSLSRLPQSDLSDAERSKAQAHLEAHAKEEGIGGRSLAENASSELSEEEEQLVPNAPYTVSATNTANVAVATTTDPEQRARSHIRLLMKQQDPGITGVKPKEVPGGDASLAQRTDDEPDESVVNPETPADVPGLPSDLLTQMQEALAAPGLTAEQRRGIVRYYLAAVEERLEETVIDPKAESSQVLSQGAIADAVRAAIAPLAEKVEQLERSLAVGTPNRRSLRPSAETPLPQTQGRSYTPYRPYKPEELARTNIL